MANKGIPGDSRGFQGSQGVVQFPSHSKPLICLYPVEGSNPSLCLGSDAPRPDIHVGVVSSNTTMSTFDVGCLKICVQLLRHSVGHGWAQLQNLATDGVAHYVKFQLLANRGYPYEPRGRGFESLRARHKLNDLSQPSQVFSEYPARYLQDFFEVSPSHIALILRRSHRTRIWLNTRH